MSGTSPAFHPDSTVTKKNVLEKDFSVKMRWRYQYVLEA